MNWDWRFIQLYLTSPLFVFSYSLSSAIMFYARLCFVCSPYNKRTIIALLLATITYQNCLLKSKLKLGCIQMTFAMQQ